MEHEIIVLDGGIPDGMAQLNITYSGQNGTIMDPVPYDLTDAEIRALATEALQDGQVQGIDAQPNPDFSDYIVDRFPATDDLPNRLFYRYKTPFGA